MLIERLVFALQYLARSETAAENSIVCIDTFGKRVPASNSLFLKITSATKRGLLSVKSKKEGGAMRAKRSVILSGLLGTLALMNAGGAAAQDAAFDGAYVYQVKCASCHGKKGEGIPLFGIPLRGNPFITQGTPQGIAEAIHKGRKGEMKRYPDYSGMPRFQGIRAAELSALIAYMKTGLQQ